MINFLSIIECLTAITSAWIIKKYLDIFFKKKKRVHILNILTWGSYLFFQITIGKAEDMTPLIRLLIDIIVVLFICLLTYEGDIHKKILLSVLMHVLWMASELLTSYMFKYQPLNLYESITFGSIISKIFMIIIVILLSIYVNPRENKGISLKYWFPLFSVPLSSICISYNIFVLEESNNSSMALSLVSFILIIFINLLIIEIYDRLSESLEIQKENVVFEQQLELLEKHAEEREEAMSDLKDLKHDIKNHLGYLKEIIEQDRKEDAINFLHDILEESEFRSFEVAKSGNAVVDTLINYKYSVAKKFGIKFNINLFIPCKLPFREKDLCVILGNALDNAIEAAKQSEDEKFVDISIVCKKEALSIVIKNSFNGIIKKDNSGTILTSKKEEADYHGHGIISIKKAIHRYNGEMVIETENQIFRLTILLDL